LFKAQKKEEYGYGIYDNVITSGDLEEIFRKGNPIKTTKDVVPKRIGIIHCVGSRDEKVGNEYCSKVCCITGVKQAIELKEALPETEIFCFYMDLRMFGKHFEELYREAQEKWGIRFVRGRLSETCENMDGSLLIKVEDTLAGKPMKMNVDLLVLLAGMVPSKGTEETAHLLNVNIGSDGFISSEDEHLFANSTNIKGVFTTGAATGPKCVSETLSNARSAALKIAEYLKYSS
jgi:heterodisulfide reductase subunit A